MPRKVTLGPAGVRSVVVTEAHHRAGYLRTGKHTKVWCSCGWVVELDGGYDAMQMVVLQHKQEEAVHS